MSLITPARCAALLCATLIALPPLAAGESKGKAGSLLSDTPGYQANVAAGTTGHRFALYIPKQYATDLERKFPVLFCQHPGGNPAGEVNKWGPWAERFGVVVVGIIGPSNSMAQHEKPPIQDAVAKTVVSELRTHPQLRWTWGVSGGSADGARFLRRKPDQFAGACLVAAFGGPTGVKLNHLAFGIVQGGKDDICSAKGVLGEAITQWKTQGNPLRWNLSQMGAHTGGPPGAAEEMLTWLVWQGKLSAPFLTPDEHARHVADAAAWAKTIAEDSDADRQMREAALFLHLPTEAVPGFDKIASLWRDRVLAAVSALSAPDRLAALSDALSGERWQPTSYGKTDPKPCWIVTLGSSGGPHLPAEIRQSLDKEKNAAASDAAAAKDWDLLVKMRACVLAEIDGGLDFDRAKAVFAAYETVAKVDPANRWCQQAAQHGARVRSYWERKSPENAPARAASASAATTTAPKEEPKSNDGAAPAPGAP
ncbi:hypothetical protein LBMAG53_06390 [Planctomycetota bacterium]|nr:hypothetical protein LBMAG53_06390 [Planctomycetota bacterium]